MSRNFLLKIALKPDIESDTFKLCGYNFAAFIKQI
jgi:hypothetical protein